MSKNIVSGTLKWQIHGEYITNFFRTLYYQGQELDVVVNKLTRSIIDLPEDTARQIILGSKKFTGINELVLEDDDKTIINIEVKTKEDIKKEKLDKLITKMNFYEKSDGWIDTEGNLFACGYMEHMPLINHLINEKLVDFKDEREFEEVGWVKLAHSDFHFMPYIYDEFKKLRKRPMTKSQSCFIWDYAKENNMRIIKINGMEIKMDDLYDYLREEFGAFY